jgi:hypothetical protein
MTPWATDRRARGLLWRHIEDVAREHPEWTWERQGREVQKRMVQDE